MAKTEADLIQLLRNVTGRVDESDPLFTNQIMLQYITDFAQLESTQDVRIFKNRTWYEFAYGPSNSDPFSDPFPVDLQSIVLANGAVGASTLEPPAYADGFYIFWYQSPQEFYGIWPETQEYQPQRPTYVLYYNNELTFRGPPDREYEIKIAAYQVEFLFNDQNVMTNDYLFRYMVYGAALDIFSDYGEVDKYRDTFPAFQRYRALVYSRTNSQYQNQRPAPEF